MDIRGQVLHVQIHAQPARQGKSRACTWSRLVYWTLIELRFNLPSADSAMVGASRARSSSRSKPKEKDNEIRKSKHMHVDIHSVGNKGTRCLKKGRSIFQSSQTTIFKAKKEIPVDPNSGKRGCVW